MSILDPWLEACALDNPQARQDRIAALLGCQTLRQAHGKHRQYLAYLIVGGFAALAFSMHANYTGGFLSMWVAVLLIWFPLRPIRKLVALRLAPSLLADQQLQACVIRQLRRYLLEQLSLLTLLIVAMGATSKDPGLHQPFLAIAFSSCMLAVSLALAKLAWRGTLSQRQLNIGTVGSMLSVYVGTLVLSIN